MTLILNGDDVIMVDDNASERMFARDCYQLAGLENDWREFEDGPTFLAHMGAITAGGDLPAVVLLDINMPGMNGFDVLAALREQPRFSKLPVFMMLTSSNRPEDVKHAEQLGASAYQVKPDSIDDYVEMFKQLPERFS